MLIRTPAPGRRGASLLAIAVLATITAGGTSSAGAATSPALGPHFGPVIDAVGYDPQLTCDPAAKPGVLTFRAFAERHFGARDLGISRSCSSGGTSEHKEGRAWDAAYNYYNLGQRRNAERLIAWLLAPDEFGNRAANAKRLGVMYMIWHNQIWGAYNDAEGWRPYSGPDAHTSHIHLSFTWDGALRQTTWYAAHKSFLDPYEPWTSTTTSPTEDALNPVLTVRPVDSPPGAATPAPRPVRVAHKVYDELHGAVISATHYSH